MPPPAHYDEESMREYSEQEAMGRTREITVSKKIIVKESVKGGPFVRDLIGTVAAVEGENRERDLTRLAWKAMA